MVEVAPLGPDDRAGWEMLARDYKAFYEDVIPDEDYERTWKRLMADSDVHGLGGWLDGELVGFAHYMFHPHTWLGEVCYLQHLFTAPDTRGKGVATALIDRVGWNARRRGAAKYYWLTKADNPARALYDRIARNKGFIRYDYPR